MMLSSSFHVTLTSGANKNEFPSNKANRFKNRLYHPLILRELGWRVGLSSMSLPVARQDLRAMHEDGKWLFIWTFWTNLLLEKDSGTRILTEEAISTDLDVLVKNGYVTSSVDMMKIFADTYHRWKMIDGAKGDKYAASNGKNITSTSSDKEKT